MLFRASEITLKSCDTMAGKLIKLFDVALRSTWVAPYTALRMPRTGEFAAMAAMAAMAWGLQTYVCFCSFLMTFGKTYESIFVETTWLVYREEYLSKFKWNCYLTSKKFALTEMAMEQFWHHAPNHHWAFPISFSIQGCGKQFSKFVFGPEKQEFQGVAPKITLRKPIFQVWPLWKTYPDWP